MIADLVLAAALAQTAGPAVEIIPPPYCAPGPPIVYFDRGEHHLSELAQAILDSIAEPFLRFPVKTRILVTGHADSAGSAAANLTLSGRRAVAVRNYLIGRGIPASRLVIKAKGESDPVAEEPDGRLSRRVSVIEQISDEEHARREAAWPRGNVVC